MIEAAVVKNSLETSPMGDKGDRIKLNQMSPIGDKIKNGQSKSNAPDGAFEPVSQNDAAAQLHVGKRTVQRAKEVIDKASPEPSTPDALSHAALFIGSTFSTYSLF